MISETKLKSVILKGLWRYSFVHLGQYVKVDVDPPTPSHLNMLTNNARPVIMRIMSLEHDLPEDSQFEGPFQIGDAFTKFEIHLKHETAVASNPNILQECPVPQQISKVLEFKEREVHEILIDHINKGENGPNNWLGLNATNPTDPNKAAISTIINGVGGVVDQHLITSFYNNFKKVKEQEEKVQNAGANPLLLKAEPQNLSNMAINKLKLKLQRHQKLYSVN
jgi:hypothetical protein